MKAAIVRALFNRPEMLYLSIKYEIAAREYYNNADYITLFCVEHGAPEACLNIIDKFYPYEHIIIKRPYRHFGWANILEGFKSAAKYTDAYVINIEDDSIIHKTFFKYIEKSLELIGEDYSVLNSCCRSIKKNDVSIIRYENLFEGPSSILNINFLKKYVFPYANTNYYKNRAAVIRKVNERNKNSKFSKYRKSAGNALQHVGWDGLVNRLIDTAFIEEGLKSVSPLSARQRHIGFYGFNRPGKFPVRIESFDKRVEWLEKAISSAKTLNKLSRTYNDYKDFDPALDTWDGKLCLTTSKRLQKS